jgi:periplasmic divalent cation tolerance protein
MILITSSCGSRDEADRIATALIEGALAACVQILPATSIYRWKGNIERSAEFVLHIKTRAAHADLVEAKIRELHSYELPELLMLPIAGGSADYLGWMQSETAI